MTAEASLSAHHGLPQATSPRNAILLIHQDDSYCQSLIRRLRRQDFRVLHESTAASGIRRALSGDLDMIVVDAAISDMNATSVCQRIRQFSAYTPIVLLSDQPSDVEIVFGLDAGANDYFSRTINDEVFFARVRTHLRNAKTAGRVGKYKLHPSWKMLIDEQKRKVPLTYMEAKLLKRLYRDRGKAVPRETLMRDVWGSEPCVSAHALETQIYRLRLKIETDPRKARILFTSPGGYGLQVGAE